MATTGARCWPRMTAGLDGHHLGRDGAQPERRGHASHDGVGLQVAVQQQGGDECPGPVPVAQLASGPLAQ